MAKCPFRWTHVGNNLCIAPEDYDGKCSPAMDFSNYDYEMRIRRASECIMKKTEKRLEMDEMEKNDKKDKQKLL
ncbi:CPW-WPC family protein, putative [Plasmodium malariae]|uniref:CPW-WPC family protein, putative n=1 Tax=Plasmodium malariae TaxID=5858 RepID=A0A1A8W252_PLAMA|nr:CPW-WPC family protein, putative [Plasmodium malariae]